MYSINDFKEGLVWNSTKLIKLYVTIKLNKINGTFCSVNQPFGQIEGTEKGGKKFGEPHRGSPRLYH
jgi:hypothetical protein